MKNIYCLLFCYYFLSGCANNSFQENGKSAQIKKKPIGDSLEYPSEKTTEQKRDYYDDTTLKGGYFISQVTKDSMEYLYLIKKRVINKIIASASNGILAKNLGYKIADFDNCFVLGHSFGSGNPTYIELIDKTNGKNILNDGAIWIGADENQGLLMYALGDLPDLGSKMILYNVNNHHVEYFTFPKQIIEELSTTNLMSIDTVDDKKIIVRLETPHGTIKKMIKR